MELSSELLIIIISSTSRTTSTTHRPTLEQPNCYGCPRHDLKANPAEVHLSQDTKLLSRPQFTQHRSKRDAAIMADSELSPKFAPFIGMV